MRANVNRRHTDIFITAFGQLIKREREVFNFKIVENSFARPFYDMKAPQMLNAKRERREGVLELNRFSCAGNFLWKRIKRKNALGQCRNAFVREAFENCNFIRAVFLAGFCFDLRSCVCDSCNLHLQTGTRLPPAQPAFFSALWLDDAIMHQSRALKQWSREEKLNAVGRTAAFVTYRPLEPTMLGRRGCKTAALQ